MRFLIKPAVTGTVMFVMCRQRVKWFSPTVVNPGCESGMDKMWSYRGCSSEIHSQETRNLTEYTMPNTSVFLWRYGNLELQGNFSWHQKKTLQGNFSWHQKQNTRLSMWFASLLTNFSSLSYFCLLLARALWYFIHSIKPPTHVWQGALDDSWV